MESKTHWPIHAGWILHDQIYQMFYDLIKEGRK
jgi:hypothetical protein